MKTKTVSLPEELLAKGLEKARSDNRNFSSYVQNLIQKDTGVELVPVKREESAEQEEAA